MVLLQVLVCGSPEVDVNLLEACTEYNACSRHDSHVGYFWDVLRYAHMAAFLPYLNLA